MLRAYELCALEWGPDSSWIDPEPRVTCQYRIYQYETEAGDLVEIYDELQPDIGVIEVSVSRLSNPDFRLSDVYMSDANTDKSCVQEGGWYR